MSSRRLIAPEQDSSPPPDPQRRRSGSNRRLGSATWRLRPSSRDTNTGTRRNRGDTSRNRRFVPTAVSSPQLFRRSPTGATGALASATNEEDDDENAWTTTPSFNRSSSWAVSRPNSSQRPLASQDRRGPISFGSILDQEQQPQAERASRNQRASPGNQAASPGNQGGQHAQEGNNATQENSQETGEPEVVDAECRPVTVEELVQHGVIRHPTELEIDLLVQERGELPPVDDDMAIVLPVIQNIERELGVQRINSQRSVSSSTSNRSNTHRPPPQAGGPRRMSTGSQPAQLNAAAAQAQRSLRDVVAAEKTADEIENEVQLAIRMSLAEQEEEARHREAFATHTEYKTDYEDDLAVAQFESQANIAAQRPPNPSQSSNRSIDTSYLSPMEAELIEKALREADEAENAASLELALQLQREEAAQVETARLGRQQQQGGRQPQGNVRTITREEYQMEQLGLNDNQNRAQADFADLEDTPDQDLGYRINAAGPASTALAQWSRVGGSGNVIGPGQEMRTKHDVELQALSNAHRLEADHGTQVGNTAYNAYKNAERKQNSRESSRTGKSDEKASQAGSMDCNFRMIITRATANGLISKCNGVVNEGKEAVIYHANPGTESDGFDVAVKVFKRFAEFRGRDQYVDGDPRYRGQEFRKADQREQMELWAEKEYRNLIRAQRGGVPVPRALMQKENVLFMRFLGTDGWPAPQLKDLDLPSGSAKWKKLYSQTMLEIRRLHQVARLVHGDLSEYNILLCPASQVEDSDAEIDEADVQIAFIDFGQAVDWHHPSADEFLRRDLDRIRSFFEKKGARTLDVDTAHEFILKPLEEDGKKEESDPNLSAEANSNGIGGNAEESVKSPEAAGVVPNNKLREDEWKGEALQDEEVAALPNNSALQEDEWKGESLRDGEATATSTSVNAKLGFSTNPDFPEEPDAAPLMEDDDWPEEDFQDDEFEESDYFDQKNAHLEESASDVYNSSQAKLIENYGEASAVFEEGGDSSSEEMVVFAQNDKSDSENEDGKLYSKSP